MNKEWERMWKEAVVDEFMVLSRNLPRETEAITKKKRVFGPRYEPGTSRIYVDVRACVRAC